MAVSGGISQSTQIGSQMTLIGTESGLCSAGIELKQMGAAYSCAIYRHQPGPYRFLSLPQLAISQFVA